MSMSWEGVDAATHHATTKTLNGRSRRKERASDITAGLRAWVTKTAQDAVQWSSSDHAFASVPTLAGYWNLETGICQFDARTDKFGKGFRNLPFCNTIQISAERYQFPTNRQLYERPSLSFPYRRYVAAAGALWRTCSIKGYQALLKQDLPQHPHT